MATVVKSASYGPESGSQLVSPTQGHVVKPVTDAIRHEDDITVPAEMSLPLQPWLLLSPAPTLP